VLRTRVVDVQCAPVAELEIDLSHRAPSCSEIIRSA
jgi:hypothetical protein